MDESSHDEIKQHLLNDWDKWQYKNELARDVMMKYIFGPYERNEHLSIDDIWAICQEIEAEKLEE